MKSLRSLSAVIVKRAPDRLAKAPLSLVVFANTVHCKIQLPGDEPLMGRVQHTAINTDPGLFLGVYSFHKIVHEEERADTRCVWCLRSAQP
jgi:hypothetical protein